MEMGQVHPWVGSGWVTNFSFLVGSVGSGPDRLQYDCLAMW